jgi:hypothetical protein
LEPQPLREEITEELFALYNEEIYNLASLSNIIKLMVEDLMNGTYNMHAVKRNAYKIFV